jgi:septum formation protein
VSLVLGSKSASRKGTLDGMALTYTVRSTSSTPSGALSTIQHPSRQHPSTPSLQAKSGSAAYIPERHHASRSHIGHIGRAHTKPLTLVPTLVLASDVDVSFPLTLMLAHPNVQPLNWTQVVPADLDERALGDRTDGANPEVLVKLLAETKGAAVVGALKAGKAAAGVPGCTCVLTGDQVVVHDGTILEKPVDADEARRFIAAYSGGECTTVGSCTATDPATGVQFTVVEVATLVFEEIPDLTTVTAMLITEGEIFYCAGALMAENPLLVPHIKEVKGTIDAVLGLSPRAVCEALNGLAAAIQPAP